uniref:PA domain-containing protein n=1 Tax=Rhizochromulina marina TaxID=1034831 RepID=A0A7S2WWY7_9STRA|mmetsp:Transcript_9402/g.26549  ORF Transcript_9402/g.26549 Transcript_9402/m.26549 type:complete len:654 (+) Transcript_9402:262-2223(+)
MTMAAWRGLLLGALCLLCAPRQGRFLGSGEDSIGEAVLPGDQLRPFIFLKTHKTGGSSVATWLHRLHGPPRPGGPVCFVPPHGLDALQWNLSIASDKFRVEAQARRLFAVSLPVGAGAGASAPLDCWTSHVLYSAQLHALVRRDAVLLTIVRNPVRRWLSAWSFYGVPQRKGFLSCTQDGGGQGWRWGRAGGGAPPPCLSDDQVLADYVGDQWKALVFGDLADRALGSGGSTAYDFNGLVRELTGDVYPATTMRDAEALAWRIRRGCWRLGSECPQGEVETAPACTVSSPRGYGHEAVLLLERFEESIAVAGALLGVAPGASLAPHLALPVNERRAAPQVPPPVLSPSVERMLEDLVAGDQMVYAAAQARFQELLEEHFSDTAVLSTWARRLRDLSEDAVHFCRPESTGSRRRFQGLDCGVLTLSDAQWTKSVNDALGTVTDEGPGSFLPARASCSGIAGEPQLAVYSDLPCALADYGGAAAPHAVVEGDIQMANPTDACTPQNQVKDGAGPKVLVAIRGGCAFGEKATRSYEAGYRALVVADPAEETPTSNNAPLLVVNLGNAGPVLAQAGFVVVTIPYTWWESVQEGRSGVAIADSRTQHGRSENETDPRSSDQQERQEQKHELSPLRAEIGSTRLRLSVSASGVGPPASP